MKLGDEIACSGCGEMFIKNVHNKKYCSSKCSNKCKAKRMSCKWEMSWEKRHPERAREIAKKSLIKNRVRRRIRGRKAWRKAHPEAEKKRRRLAKIKRENNGKNKCSLCGNEHTLSCRAMKEVNRGVLKKRCCSQSCAVTLYWKENKKIVVTECGYCGSDISLSSAQKLKRIKNRSCAVFCGVPCSSKSRVLYGSLRERARHKDSRKKYGIYAESYFECHL